MALVRNFYIYNEQIQINFDDFRISKKASILKAFCLKLLSQVEAEMFAERYNVSKNT